MTSPNALFAAHAPQGFDKDERYTPQWIFDGLGLRFDIDPASPGHGAGDCVPTFRKLTKADNGLTAEWGGRAWLNPPFSNASAWARRFIEHGDGVFLGPIANAAWTIELMAAAEPIWLCRDFAFTHPTHSGRRSSMPLFMAALGADSAAALARLATSTRHPGVLVTRKAAAS